MPILDRREPGVYVTIEDASYVAPPAIVGRTIYSVGLCPKGPHNRVVEVTSQQEFRQLFGEPDFYKTTLSHYCMDAGMGLTGRGLYVRLMPDDSKLANAFIKENDSPTTTVGTAEEFTFNEDSREVQVDSSVFDEVSIGDWIFANDGEDTFSESKQVISKDPDNGIYTLNAPYQGSTEGWGTKNTTASIYVAYTVQHKDLQQDVWYEESADLEMDDVYGIHAYGAGTYYNKIKLKGTRNTEMEKMYTDEEGNVKYPYLFMNIGVYEEQDNGNDRLLEGPWLVSLTKKNPENALIRELATGQNLFIQQVINDRSKLVHLVGGPALDQLALPASGGETNIEKSNENRKRVMLLLSAGTPVGTRMHVEEGNAVQLANGDNGTADSSDSVPLYNEAGNLYVGDKIRGSAALAFSGELTSVDGTIEQLKEVTYPWFQPDYIISGGWDAATQDGARSLAWYRQDCFHLADSGFKTSVSDDLDGRLNDFPWNHWTSMLYPQWRRIRDNFTGEKIMMTPVYHAIQNHLSVDASYFVAEPVAGIEKGAITEPMELAYKANHTERGDLQEAELNPTIVEPDGKYFLTQLTTWKRLSILKRAHAAKFVAYVRKMLPPLLKDILQRKATSFWVSQAQFRTNYFLSRFANSSVEAYKVLDSYSVSVEFDDVSSEINVFISMKPIRAIERINVYIMVQ